MSKIVIEKTVLLGDDHRDIHISVEPENVTVHVSGSVGSEFLQVISWEQLENAEHLSTLFDYEYVKVFKELIIMLGKIYNNKDTYQNLL